MRQHIRFIVPATVLSLAFTANGLPQTPPAAKPADIPVNVEVVISKIADGKKILGSYSIPATANGEPAQVRIGREIPAGVSNKFQFLHIGAEVNFAVKPTDDGRFTMSISVAMNSLSTEGRIDNFMSANTVTLGDGQTTQYTGFDKQTGETRTIDVKLTTVK